MRLTLYGDLPRSEPNDGVTWDIGAAVLQSVPGGSIYLELGPADGPAQIRLTMSQAEAHRLIGGLRQVVGDGGEAVVMA
jgi:hypothetical protein